MKILSTIILKGWHIDIGYTNVIRFPYINHLDCKHKKKSYIVHILYGLLGYTLKIFDRHTMYTNKL